MLCEKHSKFVLVVAHQREYNRSEKKVIQTTIFYHQSPIANQEQQVSRKEKGTDRTHYCTTRDTEEPPGLNEILRRVMENARNQRTQSEMKTEQASYNKTMIVKKTCG